MDDDEMRFFATTAATRAVAFFVVVAFFAPVVLFVVAFFAPVALCGCFSGPYCGCCGGDSSKVGEEEKAGSGGTAHAPSSRPRDLDSFIYDCNVITKGVQQAP